MLTKQMCRDCDKARKRSAGDPYSSRDEEIRMLVAPGPIDSAKSAAAAAVAVAAARAEAAGASKASVVAGLNFLRGSDAMPLDPRDFVRGNAPRAARPKEHRTAPMGAASPRVAPKGTKRVRSPSPEPPESTIPEHCDSCSHPQGKQPWDTSAGTLQHPECVDPRSFCLFAISL